MIAFVMPLIVLCPGAAEGDPLLVDARRECPSCGKPIAEHEIVTVDGKPIGEPE